MRIYPLVAYFFSLALDFPDDETMTFGLVPEDLSISALSRSLVILTSHPAVISGAP
jgi:hypothetical protein